MGACQPHGTLTGATPYAFVTGTAQALAVIHAAGVVHRDVKPQNVILTTAGPQVLNFGITHAADGTPVTRTGAMTGTPGWISPERYRTGTTGPEGDMFAWGTLVAYAATARLPFGTGAPDVVAYRVMSEEPDLDSLPDELREPPTQALAKNPTERISAPKRQQKNARGSWPARQPRSSAQPPNPSQRGSATASPSRGTSPAWRTPPGAFPRPEAQAHAHHRRRHRNRRRRRLTLFGWNPARRRVGTAHRPRWRHSTPLRYASSRRRRAARPTGVHTPAGRAARLHTRNHADHRDRPHHRLHRRANRPGAGVDHSMGVAHPIRRTEPAPAAVHGFRPSPERGLTGPPDYLHPAAGGIRGRQNLRSKREPGLRVITAARSRPPCCDTSPTRGM